MSDTPRTYESDTPETCEAVERWQQGKINIFDEMARLETERNKERKVSEKRRTLLIYFMEAVDKLEDECDKARKWAKRWKERAYYYRIDCAGTLAERDNLLQVVQVRRRERDEQTAQMCQAIGYLSTIAEDCEAWLNGESDEPSMEFIKAVRDYVRKAING